MPVVTVLRVMLWLSLELVLVSALVCLIKKLFGKAPRLERTLTVLLVAGAVLGTGYWLVSHEIASRRISRNAQEAADKRAKVSRRETQDAIGTLITTSQAVRDWKNNLCTQDSDSPVFTSELQGALVRTDNRPVFITGLLSDMKDRAGQHVLTITSYPCRGTELTKQDWF
jgi:hypothetical protein